MLIRHFLLTIRFKSIKRDIFTLKSLTNKEVYHLQSRIKLLKKSNKKNQFNLVNFIYNNQNNILIHNLDKNNKRIPSYFYPIALLNWNIGKYIATNKTATNTPTKRIIKGSKTVVIVLLLHYFLVALLT